MVYDEELGKKNLCNKNIVQLSERKNVWKYKEKQRLVNCLIARNKEIKDLLKKIYFLKGGKY